MSVKYIVIASHPRTDREPIVTYWYGPDHGWGTTSSSDKTHAARFLSRDQAERALKKVYGTMAEARRHGYSIKQDKAKESK